MAQLRGAAVIALLAVLLAAGCHKADSGDGASGPGPLEALPITAADQAAADMLRALPFNGSKVTGVVDVLRRANVGVYPDDAAIGAEPVRLTRWQVSNLATEAANGGGVRGSTLSELAALPDGAPHNNAAAPVRSHSRH